MTADSLNNADCVIMRTLPISCCVQQFDSKSGSRFFNFEPVGLVRLFIVARQKFCECFYVKGARVRFLE